MKEYVLRCARCKRIFKTNYPPERKYVLCPSCCADDALKKGPKR